MGMFDYFLVKRCIIDEILSDNDILSRLKEFAGDSEYYHFQTKDLDKFLFTYFLEDGKLYVDEKIYIDTQEEEVVNKERRYATEYSGRINFYEYILDVNGYNIFIKFDCLIVNGDLFEIGINSIEKEEVAELQRQAQENMELWNKIKSTPYWGLYQLLVDIEFMFNPLRKKFNNFKEWLKSKAENSVYENR